MKEEEEVIGSGKGNKRRGANWWDPPILQREKRGAQRKEKGFKYKLYIEFRINHLFRWFCDVCNKAIYGARGVYCTVNNKIWLAFGLLFNDLSARLQTLRSTIGCVAKVVRSQIQTVNRFKHMNLWSTKSVSKLDSDFFFSSNLEAIFQQKWLKLPYLCQ